MLSRGIQSESGNGGNPSQGAGHQSYITAMAIRSSIFYIAIVLVAACLLSCSSEDKVSVENQSPVLYSFFVAGHVYGKPSDLYKPDQVHVGGLHPPFKAQLEFLRNYPNLQFGVLTGDIVKSAIEKNWNIVDSELAGLDCPIYFAVGNHDMSDRELFEHRYGPTYFSFLHDADLFIVLDPNLDHWNISGEQLAFLRTALDQNKKAEHIFIFAHQLLWWTGDNNYRRVRPNSTDGRADSTNFWSEVEPLLKSAGKEVYLFGGDIGAHPGDESFMYDQYANLHFIASGMGGGLRDNFVICSIHEDGSVSFDLIALNGDDKGALGILEDYALPSGWSRFWWRVRARLSRL